MSQKACDWAEEARRIRSSEPYVYGVDGPPECATHQTTYMATANALWLRATEEERRGVVEAFAGNEAVTAVEMVNSLVGDGLAVAWGAVLRANKRITSSYDGDGKASA